MEKIKRILTTLTLLIMALLVAFGVKKTIQTEETSTESWSDASTPSEAFKTTPNTSELLSITAALHEEVSSVKELEPTTKIAVEKTTAEIEKTTAKQEKAEEKVYEEDDNDNYGYDDVDDYSGSYAGTFELTAYEWTGEPMANGEYPHYGACASNYFPLGTTLYIEDHGTFVVKDRGGMANNVIDIYLGDPDACWEFGRKFNVRVYYA